MSLKESQWKIQKSVRGFTLLELLVVIAIIGVLAGVVLASVHSSTPKARDARRKADLRNIRSMLELYYLDHGKYPQAGDCPLGYNCYVLSTGDEWSPDNNPAYNHPIVGAWIPGLVPKYAPSVPVDPINTDGYWISGHYSYQYGNVSATGQTYDLTTELENPNDPERCGIKHYSFGEGVISPPWYWCDPADLYDISDPIVGPLTGNDPQVYESSPPN